MNSNVTLLTEDILEELKALHLGGILASVLGSKSSVHDPITQVSRSFEKTVRGVKLCVENNMPVMCNMVVSAKNINDIINTASMLKEIGVESFAATPACRPSNCQDFSLLELSKDEILQVFNDLIWIKKNLGMRVTTLVAVPLCILLSFDDMTFGENKRCGAGSSFAMISSGGRMRPCPNSNVEYGSVLEEGIKAVWQKMTDWRTDERIPPSCMSCAAFARCGGGCRYKAERVSGDSKAGDPLMDFKASSKVVDFFSRDSQNIEAKKLPLKGKLELLIRKIRSEEFGGLITSQSDTNMLVDKVGFELISNLLSKTEAINIEDVVNDRNREFFSILYLRGFLDIIS